MRHYRNTDFMHLRKHAVCRKFTATVNVRLESSIISVFSRAPTGEINDLRNSGFREMPRKSTRFHEDPQSSVIYAPFLDTVFRALIEAIWNTSDNHGDSEKCGEHTHGNSMNIFNCGRLDCPWSVTYVTSSSGRRLSLYQMKSTIGGIDR